MGLWRGDVSWSAGHKRRLGGIKGNRGAAASVLTAMVNRVGREPEASRGSS